MQVRIYLFNLLFVLSLSAQSMSFEEIAQATLKYNANLQIIQLDEEIFQSDINLINTSYYPTLSLGINGQYSRNLDGNNTTYASVGDSVFGGDTQYETSGSFVLNQTLYDFGIRESKKDIARFDKEMVRFRLGEEQRKILLELLQLYSELLVVNHEIKYLQENRSLQKKIYSLQNRLFKAGELDRLTLSEQAIHVLQLEEQDEYNQGKYQELLEQIRFYTGEEYYNNVTPQNFKIFHIPSLSYEQSEGYYQHFLEIQKKEAELSQLNASLYPQFRLYGKYNFYGVNNCSIWCALDDFKQKNYVVGVSLQLNIFEGFKYNHQKQKIALELQKLHLTNEQKRREFTQKNHAITTKIAHQQASIDATYTSLLKHEYRTQLSDSLSEINERDAVASLREHSKVLQKRFEYQKLLIQQDTQEKELELRSMNNFTLEGIQ